MKTIAALSVTAAVVAAVTVVKNVSQPAATPRPLAVMIAEPDQLFTGAFIIDPNRSPVDSLELLPGIGPVLADRIVKYRRDHRFESEVDIINVTGIGPRLYQKIKPYLRVRP